jgi:hypothetical protein
MSRRGIWLLVLVLIAGSLTALPQPTAHANAFHQQLAEYWAPEFYQDLNDSYGYRADLLTNFDYDGDWQGNNNWDNLPNYTLYSYVYYSVVETSSHWFIGYWTFHPRDDGPTLPVDDTHENDLEGVLVVVRKDGTTYGAFHLMETQAHNQWYQYTNDPSISSGSDNVDSGVLLSGNRPKVFIQANGSSVVGNGHGVHAYDGSGAPGGDGIVYYYNGTASAPVNMGGNYTQKWSYALKSLDELWNRRDDRCNGCTFDGWAKFDGNNGKTDAATAPWGWDDSDDGPTFSGDVLADPAHFVDTHLNGLGTFSHSYVVNNYATHVITIHSVTAMADRDGWGAGDSDIFLKVSIAGESVVDARLWKRDESPVGTVRYPLWGTNNAEFGGQYSHSVNYRYVAKPPGSLVTIRVYDSDGTSGDEDMGYLQAAPAVGTTTTWTDALTSNGQAKISASIQALR